VDVRLTAGPQQMSIAWQESGGPPVAAPDREGFGTTLLTIAARQLGEITRDWNPAGVTARIILRNRDGV